MEQQHSNNWFNVNLGRGYSRDDVKNIVREVRALFVDNLYPQGDRKQKAQIKVTIDAYGQYHIYLNHQALQFILIFASRLRDAAVKQESKECPPEVPDFLRWDEKQSSGSKPVRAETGSPI